MENILLIVIIGLTAITSYMAFNDASLMDKLDFNPVAIRSQRQWYRFFSYGLVHAGWTHLLLNLYVLWIFGEAVLQQFRLYHGPLANLFFIGLYIPGLALATLYSYWRNRHNDYYRAVGASGAVSAVVFSFIMLYPSSRMGLLFIPVMIPGWIFGGLYLAYSMAMAKRGADNIGHDAHFYGAIYGIIFTFVTIPNAMHSFFYAVFYS